MELKPKIILIGGLGFVGRNIIDVLAQKDEENILIIDNLKNAVDGFEYISHQQIHDDLSSAKVFECINNIKEKKIFIFLAGETRVADSLSRPLDFIEENISKPAKFVSNCVGQGDVFILISTAGALFSGEEFISEKSIPNPKNFYGASKLAEENILEKLVSASKAIFKVIRMTNVYGRYSDNKSSAIHAFIRASLNNTKIFVNGDGNQTRDFIFSEDVANGIVNMAINHNKFENTYYFLGSGSSYSINEIINTINNISEGKIICEYRESKELIATEPRNVVIDKNSLYLNSEDELTNLLHGLKETRKYYSND